MPKKHSKKSNTSNNNKVDVFCDGSEEQAYYRIDRLLGDRRVVLRPVKNPEQTIQGKMRKVLRRYRSRVVPGAVVIACLRDFDADTVDIIHVYTEHEAYQLLMLKEIPSPEDAHGMDDNVFTWDNI